MVGSALLTWLVLNYRAVRSPLRFWHGLGEESGKSFLGNHGLVKDVPHAYYVGVQDAYGGFVVPAVALLWVAFALFRPRKISIGEWFLAGVAALSLLAFSFTPKTSTRYYLPIGVVLSLLAALGAFHWAALASARWPRARVAAAALALLVSVGAAASQWSDLLELRAGLQKDDRAELVAAVRALPATAVIVQDQAVGLPEPDRLWYHEDLEPLPQKVRGAKQACDLGTLAELKAQGVTHLALNAKTYGRYFAPDLIVKDHGDRERGAAPSTRPRSSRGTCSTSGSSDGSDTSSPASRSWTSRSSTWRRQARIPPGPPRPAPRNPRADRTRRSRSRSMCRRASLHGVAVEVDRARAGERFVRHEARRRGGQAADYGLAELVDAHLHAAVRQGDGGAHDRRRAHARTLALAAFDRALGTFATPRSAGAASTRSPCSATMLPGLRSEATFRNRNTPPSESWTQRSFAAAPSGAAPSTAASASEVTRMRTHDGLPPRRATSGTPSATLRCSRGTPA